MDFESLLACQELDTRIAQLQHRLEADPAHAALTSARADLASLNAAAVELFGRRDSVRQEQKRLEDEAALVEAKIDKDTSVLYGGTITAPKELESIQSELASLRERLSVFDDGVLEQMELAEPLDAESEQLSARIAAATAVVEQREAEVTVMQAEVGAALDAAQAERAVVATGIDETLLATYEQARRGGGGVGAARLAPGGTCQGCHITLPSAQYAEVKRAPIDEILRCPECNRILVR